MKLHTTLGWLLIMLFLASCVNQETQKQTFVRVSGSQILEPNGNPIILKGTNIGNWLLPEGYMFKGGKASSPTLINQMLYQIVGPDSLKKFWDGFLENYITYDDIRYLKAIGVNHIRLPFHYKMFTQDEYMGGRNEGFKYLDRIVEWCKKENIYVLFDMHAAPGGQTGDNIDDSEGYPFLFQSELSKQLMSDVWVKIAKRYKDEPIVLGYDLLNEPIATYHEKDYDKLLPELYPLYKRIIKDIRAVDPNHIIFINGAIWSTNFDVFTDTSEENIVYEFHKYWFKVQQSAFQDYIDFSKKHNVPIYMGETGENNDQWILDARTMLDENGIHWAFWPYKKMDDTQGILSFPMPEHYSLITDFGKANRTTFKEIREAMPDRALVMQALNQMVENSKLKYNKPQVGYVQGLGFNVIDPAEFLHSN